MDAQAQKKAKRHKKSKAVVADTLAASKMTATDSMLLYAEKFIGVPYGYGSAGVKTFDCSGYVMHVYGKFGVALPHSSGSIGLACDEIKLEEVKPGDLLFFSGRSVSKSKIGHVSIVHRVDGEKIYMIHATVQAGVIIEELDKSEYFSKRFIMAGRLRSATKTPKSSDKTNQD